MIPVTRLALPVTLTEAIIAMDRRKVLTLGLGTASAAFIGNFRSLGDLFGIAEATQRPDQSIGERYGGFLILQPGAGLPLLDHEPDSRYIPTLEQLLGGGPATGETVEMSAEDAARLARVQLYHLADLDTRFIEPPAAVTQHVSGRVFTIVVSHQTTTPEHPHPFAAATLTVQVDAPVPVPIWEPSPTTLSVLERVSYLPAPGLRMACGPIESLEWVEDEHLYSLEYRRDVLAQSPQQVAQHLAHTRQ